MANINTYVATLSAALLAFAAFGAQAQSDDEKTAPRHEIGVGASFGKAALLNARYGYNLNRYVRIEADAARGEAVVNGGGILLIDSDDEIELWATISGVARLPYGKNNSALFIRFGGGVSQTSAPEYLTTPEITANGMLISSGSGVEHFFTPRIGVRLELAYVNDSSFDEITDQPGRSTRDNEYGMISSSLIYRF